MNPLVSIILPTYNRVEFLQFTIDSIIVQSYHNWELIIVDDCSTDHTGELVNNYVSKHANKIKYKKLNKNQGASKARNIGIELASGDYITFIDSDDRYHKEKIEQQVEVFLQSKIENLGVVTCGRNDFKSDKLVNQWLPSKRGQVLSMLFQDIKIGAGTPFLMVSRRVINEGVRFDTNIDVVEDFDFVAQALIKGFALDYASSRLVDVYHYQTERNFSYEKGFLAREYLYKKYINYLNSEPEVKKKFLRRTMIFYTLIKENYDSYAIQRFYKDYPLMYLMLLLNKKIPTMVLKRVYLKILNKVH